MPDLREDLVRSAGTGIPVSNKYLVVVADDLGRSPSINRAVAEAHDRGIVTAASIMAGGEAFRDAVRIVRERNRLSVGLHATLCDGRAVLPRMQIPDLTDGEGNLEQSPAAAGVKYTGCGILRQIEAELRAQLDRAGEADISPSHIDGHHHLHMHPLLFSMLCRLASQRGVDWIRIPREPFRAVFGLRSAARGAVPFAEWAVFGVLGPFNMKTALAYGLRSAQRVYGLSRTGNIDEGYLLDILGRIDCRVSELFVHPDSGSERGRRELEALTSPRVQARIAELGIVLTGYRELSGIPEKELA